MVSRSANLTFSSDVDQNIKMFGLHVRPLTKSDFLARTCIYAKSTHLVFREKSLRSNQFMHAPMKPLRDIQVLHL